jgi:hypothetical protein
MLFLGVAFQNSVTTYYASKSFRFKISMLLCRKICVTTSLDVQDCQPFFAIHFNTFRL